jgi:hypothetical protein
VAAAEGNAHDSSISASLSAILTNRNAPAQGPMQRGGHFLAR